MKPSERVEVITKEIESLVGETEVALVVAYPFDHKVVALHELKTNLLDGWGASRNRNFKVFSQGETGGIRGAVREFWNAWVLQTVPRAHVEKFLVHPPVVPTVSKTITPAPIPPNAIHPEVTKIPALIPAPKKARKARASK